MFRPAIYAVVQVKQYMAAPTNADTDRVALNGDGAFKLISVPEVKKEDR
jgi:hypothetical protein